MALTVDGIFTLMPELFLPEKAQGLTVSVYYQVTGEGGGDYACLIDNGVFTLKREALGLLRKKELGHGKNAVHRQCHGMGMWIEGSRSFRATVAGGQALQLLLHKSGLRPLLRRSNT